MLESPAHWPANTPEQKGRTTMKFLNVDIPVKNLPGMILLHHNQRGIFNDFISRKPLPTGEAFPASTDLFAVLGRSGIYNLAFRISTKGALQKTTFFLTALKLSYHDFSNGASLFQNSAAIFFM